MSVTGPGDYSQSKLPPGGVHPDGVVLSEWIDLEPLITAAQLRRRWLAGIAMYSLLKDPATGKPLVTITDEDLKEYIKDAIAEIELLSGGVNIFRRQFRQKLPFDQQEYEMYGFMVVPQRPVQSIEALTVTPSNGVDVFEIPLEWVETANLVKGQINIIPLAIATTDQGTVVNSQPGGGSAFLNLLAYKPWIPAYWQIYYTCGWGNGVLPRFLNVLIAIQAAMAVLSVLGPMRFVTSASLGIDGMNQSIGTPGPNIYAQRIGELEKRRDKLIERLKAYCGLKIFSGNV